MSVGTSSSRTPGKHELLNKITGREVSVAWNKGWSYTMIDLCAGDGRNTDSSGTCSPKILTGHRDWGVQRGVDAETIFVEKADATYAELQANYPDEFTIHGDARRLPELLSRRWQRDDCLFLQNDPNHINDWALSEAVLSWAPNLTTTYSTLGCNVSGLKRADLEDRLPWFEHVSAVLSYMPWRHDALLVALARDPSQWAYLVTGPQAWRDRYVKDAQKAFRGYQNGIVYFWYRENPAGFNDLREKLFLRNDERRA